ncbi:MAG: hypothetical protein IT562_09845 [Alphaproteobacteria bacterium]|nr:hypothetical protein [Alphaproteobacteria bacterium]
MPRNSLPAVSPASVSAKPEPMTPLEAVELVERGVAFVQQLVLQFYPHSGAGIAEEDEVEAVAAIEQVAAAAAHDHVVAREARDLVVGAAAVERFAGGAAEHRVIPQAAVDDAGHEPEPAIVQVGAARQHDRAQDPAGIDDRVVADEGLDGLPTLRRRDHADVVEVQRAAIMPYAVLAAGDRA